MTTTPALTTEVISEAMNRARNAACGLFDATCWDFPDPPEVAARTCDRHGRCKIGWVCADYARKTWDVVLDTTTGEGRLHPWSDGRV